MTYSIKYIFVYIISLIFFSGCLSSGLSEEEYADLCPYERKSSGVFQLQANLEVIPHQKTYQVGDTVIWRINATDSMFDYNRDMIFKIENFPFQPYFHLYKIQDNTWSSGYEHMDVLIDSVYSPRYVTGGNTFARSIRGTSTFINGEYLFEFKTVFTEPGTFINYVPDKTLFTGENEINEGLNPEYNGIINHSECPDPFYIVDYLLQGDPHYDDFQDEMVFLDKEVYYDEMVRIDGIDEDIWGRNYADIPVDWRGFFGFEMVE